MEQRDSFQPVAIIQAVDAMHKNIASLEEDDVWNDDVKRGARIALAWVHVLVAQMAENRFKE